MCLLVLWHSTLQAHVSQGTEANVRLVVEEDVSGAVKFVIVHTNKTENLGHTVAY